MDGDVVCIGAEGNTPVYVEKSRLPELVSGLRSRAESAENRVKWLSLALTQHGTHETGCSKVRWYGEPCNCGLQAALDGKG